MPGMILLEPGNRILEEAVGSQILATEKRTPMNVNLCDFDDVSYKITVEEADMDVMHLSMGLPCYYEIGSMGGNAALEQHFKEYIATPATGYDITLDIKIDDVQGKTDVVKSLSLLKSKVVGGVFDHFFNALLEGKPLSDKFKFDLRGDTTVYFIPRDDRVVVVFSIDFTEKVDKAIAKVFMQEFADARKKVGRAPPVSWGASPPSELEAWGIKENQGNLGYISFAVLRSHLDKGKKDSVITIMQSFRTFLQYHIKCSKSHFHSKMRNRVRELLKVKNRATIDDATKEKKTAAGKTFKRS